MNKPTLLITGASGQLGRRVLELLLEQGETRLIAVTRSPASLAEFSKRGVEVRRGDFDDAASLGPALQGATRALLISTDALDEAGHRLRQHQRAVRALAEVGVEHVVYTSLTRATTSRVPIARDHAGTEAALAETSLGFTVLRNNMYTDLQLFSLPNAIASGRLVHARGEGGIAYVTREDAARTAAAALARGTGREVLEVTGPSAVSASALATITAKLTGRALQTVPISLDSYREGLLASGTPPGLAALYASFDDAAAHGEFEGVTDVVERLTERKPTSVQAFLEGHRARLS